MTGSDEADEAEAGVRARVMKYLREDGNAWTEVGCMSVLDGKYALPWATGKILYALSEDLEKGIDTRELCRKSFEALRNRADWADGRAYYAGGNGFFDEDGWAISDATPYHPAMVLEPVVRYYEASGDPEALAFAIAFAEGEMANDQWYHGILSDSSKYTEKQREQAGKTSSIAVWPTAPPDIDLAVREDGSFPHHSHFRGHLGWGMAHLASITKEPRLVAWSKKLLDYFLSRGTDYGWIPESMSHPFRSETCAVSDVISMADCLAKCGYPEYWDTVERYVRNYIKNAQFFCTPEYIELYETRHPGPEGAKGLEASMRLQGGFQGGMGINDRLQDRSHMDMMGCCVPEGMRAVYTAWTDTVTEMEGVVSVNMEFDVDSLFAVVKTFLPAKGGLSIKMKTDAALRVGLPSWVEPGTETVLINGIPSTITARNGRYLEIGNVVAGDEVEIRHSLPVYRQQHSVMNVPGKPDREMTVLWRGNTVEKVDPAGEFLSIYM
jgi:hypothetical protein